MNIISYHSVDIEYISNLNDLVQLLHHEYRLVLIDEKVLSIYQDVFHSLVISDKLYSIKIEEVDKNIYSAIKIIEVLLQRGINKTDKIALIGGGAFSDTTLFVASIFKRGLHCTLLPTTLLSMVDASIGGKNAINFASVKNVLGNIYLPQKNIIVTDFLNSLSHDQILSGWAEILKIALIKDASFYKKCVHHLNKTVLPDVSIIRKAIQLKLSIIRKDLVDTNDRQLLNYGHTIAHAIEGVYDEHQQYIPHGYAVAMGMFVENILAEKLKMLPSSTMQQINEHLTRYYPLSSIANSIQHDIHSIVQKIYHDKKNTSQHIYFTLLEDIGKGKIKIHVDASMIEEALRSAVWILTRE